MKTYHIKDLLKKELLIIELPENGYYEEYRDGIEVRDFLTYEVLTLANYTLLGSPDEIKEEDLLDLVETFNNGAFRDYKELFFAPDMETDKIYLTALDSFFSAIEKEIYWVNPWGDRMPIFIEASPSAFKFVEKEKERWKEAQEKTFDKKRVKMFVKN